MKLKQTALAALLPMMYAFSGNAAAAGCEVTISCGSETPSAALCGQMAQTWGKENSCKVNVVSNPPEADKTLELYKRKFAAKATDLDVIPVDVVWPGILAGDLLDLKQYASDAELNAHFKPILESNLVAGKLLALPWFTDAGLLFYRKDLLEKYGEKVPATWEQLEATAKKIQDAERKAGNKDMWGFVFQGRSYEGLTCNALEWINSYGGGSIVDDIGLVTVNNDAAAAAINQVASFIGTISPPEVLSFAEEESRAVWHKGNAVFHRNWPYAWAASHRDGSVIAGKVGATALPKGGDAGKNTGTLGGWSFAVSKHSKHPEHAAKLALYMTAAEQQKRQAIEFSQNPTIASLYSDAEVLAANPFVEDLKGTFSNAVARPSKVAGDKYGELSEAFFTAVHSALKKGSGGEDAVAQIETKLDEISDGGRW